MGKPRTGRHGVRFVPLLLLAACAGLHPSPRGTPEPGAVETLDRLSPHPCNAVVASMLAGARVPISNVRGLVYGVHWGVEEIVGYDAWVALKDQPGAVVVPVDRECLPGQVYARGGAKLPGAVPQRGSDAAEASRNEG